MNNFRRNKTILLLSIPLSILVIITSSIGLFTPDFYFRETANWQAQSLGQDLVDLFFIVPCLIVSSVLAYRNNKAATSIWAGVMLYLSYTFVLYSFDVHFNELFFLYCLGLGLSFYSFAYFIFAHKLISEDYKKNRATRFIGVYFITVGVLFYFLWLSEIVPAVLQNTTPKSVSDAGLFTNGVQVIDLAVILPAIITTGICLLRKITVGFILTPVLLTFFILMNLTIGLLAVVMKIRGVEGDLMLTVIMGVLALVSLSLLIWYLKTMKTNTDQ